MRHQQAHVRFRHETAGGHVHVRVFSGPDALHLGMCGSLVFREEEFELLRAGLPERWLDPVDPGGLGLLTIDFLEEKDGTCQHMDWNTSLEFCPNCGIQVFLGGPK